MTVEYMIPSYPLQIGTWYKFRKTGEIANVPETVLAETVDFFVPTIAAISMPPHAIRIWRTVNSVRLPFTYTVTAWEAQNDQRVHVAGVRASWLWTKDGEPPSIEGTLLASNLIHDLTLTMNLRHDRRIGSPQGLLSTTYKVLLNVVVEAAGGHGQVSTLNLISYKAGCYPELLGMLSDPNTVASAREPKNQESPDNYHGVIIRQVVQIMLIPEGVRGLDATFNLVTADGYTPGESPYSGNDGVFQLTNSAISASPLFFYGVYGVGQTSKGFYWDPNCEIGTINSTAPVLPFISSFAYNLIYFRVDVHSGQRWNPVTQKYDPSHYGAGFTFKYRIEYDDWVDITAQCNAPIIHNDVSGLIEYENRRTARFINASIGAAGAAITGNAFGAAATVGGAIANEITDSPLGKVQTRLSGVDGDALALAESGFVIQKTITGNGVTKYRSVIGEYVTDNDEILTQNYRMTSVTNRINHYCTSATAGMPPAVYLRGHFSITDYVYPAIFSKEAERETLDGLMGGVWIEQTRD